MTTSLVDGSVPRADVQRETARTGARRPLSPTGRAVGVIALLALGLRCAYLLRPLSVLDRRFIPDDTYYTLTIARSIAHGHGPTIDGHTLTSGFQPLQGFLMTPVFWFTKSRDAALRVDLALMVVADILTLLLLAWVAYRLAGKVAAIAAAAIWAVSPAAIAMALGGLETSLALCAAIGVVAAFIWCNDQPTAARFVVVGAVSGVAALARIDALPLVGFLVVVQLWRGPRRKVWIAGVAGIVVVGPWWVWCTATFGTPLPTSGAAAHHLFPTASFSKVTQSLAAGAVSGGPIGPWEWFRARALHHPTIGAVMLWCVVAALLALSAWWLRRGSPWIYAAALPAFAAFLLVFYSWYGVIYYLTRYLAPVSMITTLIVAVFIARLVAIERIATRALAWSVAAIALIPIAAAGARTQVRDLTRTRFSAPVRDTPHSFDAFTGYRETMQRVVPHLPTRGFIGGWQSGALSYFAPATAHVVNLDGVTNPDAFDAQRHGTLAQYMGRRNLVMIADFPYAATFLSMRLGVLGTQQPARRTIAQIAADQNSPPYLLIALDWPPR